MAEGEVTEGLQGVVELVEPRVAGGPPGVATGEGFGIGGREAEEPVAAVADHVDGEVVAREDVKLRSQPVAEGEPLPFEPAGERRMLRPDAVGDQDKIGIGLDREQAAARHERRRELEADEPLDAGREPADAGDEVGIASGGEAKRWKDHRDRTDRRDHVELPAIRRLVEGRAGRIDHAGARHDFTRADRLAGEGQSLPPGGIVDELHVARVHVDGRRDAGRIRAGDVGGEGIPVDREVGTKWEQDRRHAADLAARPQERGGVDGGRGGHEQAFTKQASTKLVQLS